MKNKNKNKLYRISNRFWFYLYGIQYDLQLGDMLVLLKTIDNKDTRIMLHVKSGNVIDVPIYWISGDGCGNDNSKTLKQYPIIELA